MSAPTATPVPALLPPEGLESDFDTLYIGLQPLFIVVLSICISAAVFILACRLVAKRMDKKVYGIEDYVTIVATAGFIGWCSFLLYACHAGLGRHTWDVQALTMVEIARLGNHAEITYCPFIFVAKLALLLEYRRLFDPTRRGPIHIAIHVLIWSNLVIYTFLMFWLIFGCSPREKIWNPTIPGSCLNPTANSLFSASWNMVSDFAILVLPIYSIWHLQMPIKRRLGVSTVFLFGLCGCAASIARIVYGVELLSTDDVNYVIIENGMWSVTEFFVIVVCASFPTLPYCFRLFFGKKKSQNSYAGERYGTGRHSNMPQSNISRSQAWSDNVALTSSAGNAWVPLDGVESGKSARTKDMDADSEEFGQGEYVTPQRGIVKTTRMETREDRV